MASDTVNGAVVGFAMMIVLEFAIISCSYWRWGKSGNIIEAEVNLQIAGLSFMAMILTGYVITVGFADYDPDNTPLMEWYGYNNICVVFDYPPSTYVMPVYWCFVAYFFLRYCISDIKRLWSQERIPKFLRYFATCVLFVFGILIIGFSLVFAIKPYEDMYAHSVPFLLIILWMPLVFVVQAFEVWFLSDEGGCGALKIAYAVVVAFFFLLSWFKAVLVILALTKSFVDPILGHTIDVVYTVVGFIDFLMLQSSTIDLLEKFETSSEEETEETGEESE